MSKAPKIFHGLKLRALTLFASHWYPHGRRYTLASWHNWQSGYGCWLWLLEAYRDDRDPRRLGFFRTGNFQRRYVLQLWLFDIAFCWQAEGLRRDPDAYPQPDLAWDDAAQ